MADDAFAISPISAQPAPPTDADYEAISSAFMETARGRWFLSEFTRRNRNADTRMVLDAVARIESTLSGDRVISSDLDAASLLTDLRAIVHESRSAVLAATNRDECEALLLPVRRGARVVREIAWRWREIGTDGRICDLLETHVNAMEAGCDAMLAHDPRQTITRAFDGILSRIEQHLHEENKVTSSSRGTEAASAARRTVDTALELHATAPHTDHRIETHDLASPELDRQNAEDDAVLDMIAMEMGALDDDGDDDIFADQPSASVELRNGLAVPDSLGAALIAGGLIGQSYRRTDDPFESINRMTQPEKIALFT